MEETKEIHALLHLIDDPDSEVFDTVSNRILSFGRKIIPHLEQVWENDPDIITQQRIELLIHKVHLEALQQELLEWVRHKEQDLLTGVLLVSQYQYPELNLTPAHQDLEKIRRNIWLELNQFLTPLEQVNVLTNILFNYYKFKGSEVNYSRPDEFLLPRLLESKKGNAISNGLLILLMARLLDINLQAIAIPRQFILAYVDDTRFNEEEPVYPPEHIQFYLDGASGQMYSHQDVETYFKRIGVTPVSSYFKTLSNRRIIQLLLKEYAQCFTSMGQYYKHLDLMNLVELLENED